MLDNRYRTISKNLKLNNYYKSHGSDENNVEEL